MGMDEESDSESEGEGEGEDEGEGEGGETATQLRQAKMNSDIETAKMEIPAYTNVVLKSSDKKMSVEAWCVYPCMPSSLMRVAP